MKETNKQTKKEKIEERKKERKKCKTRKNCQRLIHMTQTLTLYIYQWLLKLNWLVLNAPPVQNGSSLLPTSDNKKK